ncbi:MAG: hypothetical protein ACOYJ1_09560 [Peptococcales bacterium]|jgi:DNA-directed RNA polymerase beta' subunit
MNWETIMVDLTLTLLPILSAIAAYMLITIARYFLRNSNNLLLTSALDNLEQIIFSTVTALSQTIVDDLKRSKPDGKLSNEEAILIKNKALSSIRTQMGEKDIKILMENFGSVDELMDNIIEKSVAENKLRRGHI